MLLELREVTLAQKKGAENLMGAEPFASKMSKFKLPSEAEFGWPLSSGKWAFEHLPSFYSEAFWSKNRKHIDSYA